MTYERADGTFPVDLPCPDCHLKHVFGFMELDRTTKKHQHTRYLCRTWQCGWEGRTVPSPHCVCGDFELGRHDWVDDPDQTRHTAFGCATYYPEDDPPDHLQRPARTAVEVPEHLLKRAAERRAELSEQAQRQWERQERGEQ